MNSLKKIYCNCRKATFLIEKKQIDSIRFSEHLELLLHLACCNPCRTYQKQSLMINRTIKKLLDNKLNDDTGLDQQFKEALQENITTQLDEK